MRVCQSEISEGETMRGRMLGIRWDLLCGCVCVCGVLCGGSAFRCAGGARSMDFYIMYMCGGGGGCIQDSVANIWGK